MGGWISYGKLSAIFDGLLDTVQVYVRGALANPDHASIIIFALMIGGMIAIISKNGGTIGIANKVTLWTRSPQSGQLVAIILGIVIFFDDYASILIVGNAMRSITDRLGISREKLAYIVDSTAAPISSLALVTTWIGYEVGIVGDAITTIENCTENAYIIFLHTVPYSFYSLLNIFFLFVLVLTKRDFGPMYSAELRVQTTGKMNQLYDSHEYSKKEDTELKPKEDKPYRDFNAIIPILVLLAFTIIGLYTTGRARTGENPTLQQILSEADPYKALIWSSLLSTLTAALLSLGQRILTIEEIFNAWLNGLKSMLPTIIILVFAWGLSDVLDILETSEFLSSALSKRLAPEILPATLFILAGITALATGSGWVTMAILMPIVVPLTLDILSTNELNSEIISHPIFYSAISSVFTGAVWGDHCSPISDTTILSSMASGCHHIDHVWTQLPYAVAVGGVALLFGILPVSFGLPWWLALLIGMVILLIGLSLFGKQKLTNK